MIRLRISGMTCEHCAETVRKVLEGIKGVKKAEVHFPQSVAEVEIERRHVNPSELIKTVEKAGYKAELLKDTFSVYISKGNIYDLFILGGGSAGFASAIKASDLGAKVLIAEGNTIGGTCLNRGCIPSKFLIDVAKEYYRLKKPGYKSIQCDKSAIDFKKISRELKVLIEDMRKEKYWKVLEAYPQINYKCGRGEFIDSGRAKVGEEEISFFKAVITTGSHPSIPPIKGIEHLNVLTSDSIFNIDFLPEHLIIIGGGAIGLEIGQALMRMGSRVSLIEVADRIGGNVEPELSDKLKKLLEKEGMEIYTSARVASFGRKGEKIIAEIVKNGKREKIEGTNILIATGRKPNTEGIGLDKLGVKRNKNGFILTNEYLQTSNDNIYAAGDCTGKYMLVTVAALEGAIAAENALLGNVKKIDYSGVPRAIFTDPELASVGYGEEELKKEGIRYRSKILEFSKVPRAVLRYKKEGMVKMLVEEKTQKILGIHILSEEGSEIIHRAVPVIKYGLTIKDVIEMVDVYPTLSESIKLCAQSFIKDVSKLSCCAQ